MTAEAGLCVLACPVIEREVRAVLAGASFAEARLLSFSASCMGPSTGGATGAASVLEAAVPGCRRALLLCGGCLRDIPASLGGRQVIRVAPGSECFSLFAPSDLIHGLLREGAYLLTPGWLSTWEARLEAWGFDEENGRAFFRESARKLVLLDTLTDARAPGLLEAFGRHVGLPASRIPVGLDFLRLLLKEAWAGSHGRRTPMVPVEAAPGEADARRRSADFAMAFELIYGLSGSLKEEEIALKVLDLLLGLFAPERVSLTLSGAEGRTRSWSHPPSAGGGEAVMEGQYQTTPDGRGMRLRIGYNEEPLGVIRMENVAFPSYLERYRSVALTVAKVCGLAIGNARAYEKLAVTVRELKESLARVKTLSALLPICAHCKKIRDDTGYWHQVETYIQAHTGTEFSHSLCPQCAKELYPEVDLG